MMKLSVSEMIEASSLYIFCCSSLLHITAANGARLALVAHSAHFTFNISATKNYLSEIIEPSLTTHSSRDHFTLLCILWLCWFLFTCVEGLVCAGGEWWAPIPFHWSCHLSISSSLSQCTTPPPPATVTTSPTKQDDPSAQRLTPAEENILKIQLL